MTPVEFKQQNIVFGKDQPEYLPLPSYTDERQTISCWRLTLFERLTLLVTGRIWLCQMNFGEALQPQLPTVDCPFILNRGVVHVQEKE